jgi:glutamate dehydrogenase (NAD(P)+)
MTWKTAVVDIPLGGSMGVVVCEPHALSATEQERICRTWVRRLARHIGPHRDIPAPDVMTSAQHMTWMLDEYEAIQGDHQPGAITGKTVSAGGSLGRTQGTGYGLVYTLRESLKDLALDPDKTTASVQGFGTVARHAVELYIRIGGTVSCVASWDQADNTSYSYRKEGGIDLEELKTIADRMGGIDRQRAASLGYEVLDGEAWLSQEVDILIPAALENQITSANVDNISERVKIVAEGANGPTSPDAERTILDRDVFLIPDLLANAGGVICSYYEQVQSSSNYYWRLDEVLSKLDHQITTAFNLVSDLARSKNLTMRDAALAIAIDRVASMCRERGWV